MKAHYLRGHIGVQASWLVRVDCRSKFDMAEN